MGQYDDIIASYEDKQANLRRQLKLLRAVAEKDGQGLGSAAKAAMRRIKYEIRDLEAAIERCREKSRGSSHPAPSSAIRIGADPAANGQPAVAMAHLVFRCGKAKRVITTGIEITRELFESLPTARTMRCKFCGQDHPWEVVQQAPDVRALMSLRAEDLLGRAVQSDAHAATATDPGIRELYERMAGQWFRLAIESEEKANALPA